MGGGGGGGGNVEKNPATNFVLPFGQAIGKVGTGLTDWFGQLKEEDMIAMAQLNPMINKMLKQAFDPQQELYNRTLQQVTDQTRSGEAARGIAMTPYGAAAEGNTISNFNIDWQNNQLKRELEGLGIAGSTYGQLISGGATAAQPAEAALQGYTSGFDTASKAQTAQSQLEEQAREFNQSEADKQSSQIGGLFSSGLSALSKGG
jgi:hypothetical protein